MRGFLAPFLFMVKFDYQPLLQLFYPSICVGCGDVKAKNEVTICSRCLANLPINEPKSYLLTHKNKYLGRLDLTFFYSFLQFRKSGIAQSLLHQIKYKGKKEIAYYLGNLCGEKLKNAEIVLDFDVLIPIPLHQTKLKRRGYNQSEVFAKGLSEIIGINLETEALIKNKVTQTQTSFNQEQRISNVKSSFEVMNPERIFGKNIVIVDDVITTGSTIEAAYEVLIAAKPKSISIILLAEASF